MGVSEVNGTMPFKTPSGLLFLVILAFLLICSCAYAASGDLSSMGSGSVPAQLNEINQDRKWPLLSFTDQYGLSLAADAYILYQQINEDTANNDSAGGVARLFGSWSPGNSKSSLAGKLIFKVEYRQTIATEIPPKDLLSEAGVASVSGPTFGDQGALLTNLYWAQHISKNRSAFVAGIVDVTDYLDVYGLYNPWTEFNNLAFQTNPTIPAPSQGLGAAILLMSTSKYYAIAGLSDANGNPQKPGDAFSSFSDGEYFKYIEFGRIGSWESRYNDNYHISFWQIDEQDDLGIDNDTGVTLSWNKQYDKWLPFLRGGYADNGVGVLKETISAGLGYAVNERGEYLGVGLNWGQAADSDIDQYTLETYFKWKPFSNLLIVPGFQYIKNPAYNEPEDDIWLVGIKMRVAI